MKYQVWVLYEEWNGDDKVADLEMCELINTDDESKASDAFTVAQDAAYDATAKFRKDDDEGFYPRIDK